MEGGSGGIISPLIMGSDKRGKELKAAETN